LDEVTRLTFDFYVVPYYCKSVNKRSTKLHQLVGKMSENRVRISDIAEELGLSTATVSNVIHGKTKKISEETIKRVQDKIDESGYIPNMAGILLAQNNSRIIGVIINEDEKYEGRVLEDGFVIASISALSHELNRRGYFLMIKTTNDYRDIPKFASMWNMDGLVLMGFCAADYAQLRGKMHISFVVYDGYFENAEKIVNLVIDHYDGGYQAGRYFKAAGHTKAVCIADNCICMDLERIEGFKAAFAPGEVIFLEIPKSREERLNFYLREIPCLMEKEVAAFFAVSDYYALDFMRFMQNAGYRVPDDVEIIGFDDTVFGRDSIPALSTIHQDAGLRAKTAMDCLEAMRDGKEVECRITLPVELILRESTN